LETDVASDFFTVEVWTARGLQRFFVLFFIDLSTRRVVIGGIARKANGLWMSQIARNVTDGIDGLFKGKRYLIHDRDPLYTTEFLRMLAEPVKLPPRSPNLNAYAERFVRTIKENCLERLIFFGRGCVMQSGCRFYCVLMPFGHGDIRLCFCRVPDHINNRAPRHQIESASHLAQRLQLTRRRHHFHGRLWPVGL
jgi:hypothetical protein